MSKVNYVLDRLYPKVSKNSWGPILKEKNTFKYKYNQVKCLSITFKGYIVDNTNTELRHQGSEIKNLKQRSEATEVRELAPAGVNLEGLQFKRLMEKNK